jgi:hypothetical protein
MGTARIRSLFCVILAAGATMLTLAPPASADAQSVGGGAAGVMTTQYVQWSRTVADDPRGFYASQSVPSVTLPEQGGNESAELLPLSTATVGVKGLSVHAARVSTFGNLQGYPYAESKASVGIALTGTDFVGVRARCRWDRQGTFASTEIVRSGEKDVWRPGVNTRVDIPGLGYAVLNEQYTETLHSGARVIYVNALHVFLFQETAEAFGISELIVGFASCDPLNVPSVGSLGLIPGGPSSSG